MDPVAIVIVLFPIAAGLLGFMCGVWYGEAKAAEESTARAFQKIE
jgi:hypothetical protein